MRGPSPHAAVIGSVPAAERNGTPARAAAGIVSTIGEITDCRIADSPTEVRSRASEIHQRGCKFVRQGSRRNTVPRITAGPDGAVG